MPRAFARYAAPLAVLVALTVVPAFASGETERVTGGGWLNSVSYFDPTPAPEEPTDPGVPPGGEPDPTDPQLPPDVVESSVFRAAGNTKCTFGFVASRTPTATAGVWEYDGELTFHDHNKGFKVKSVCVKFVDFPSANTAVFEGEAEIKCSSGPVNTFFRVTIVDNGEPSTNDTFQIELPYWTCPGDSFEYASVGNLGGGNIQLHK